MKALPHALTIILSFALFAGSLPSTLAESTTPTYHTVSGIVESDEGKPIEGANVNGWSSPAEGSNGISGSDSDVTDDAGRFTLRLPAGKGSLSMHYGAWGANEYRDLAVEGNVTDIVFTLKTPPPRTAVVEGRVLDEGGKPVGGANVQIQQACCYAYGEDYPAKPLSAEPATSAEGESSPTSEGSDERKMASSPAIMPYPCCYESGRSATTDSEGRYRFETYPGPHQVTAHAKGYAQSTAQVSAKDNETVEADLKLEKVPGASAILKGRVVDAGTGLPIPNAHVSLNNVEWSRWASAEGKHDGTFEATVLPGWTHVGVNVYEYAYTEEIALADGTVPAPDRVAPEPGRGTGPQYYAWIRAIDLKEGENELTVKLERKPAPTVALTGYVLDPEAKAGIPGAQVSIWNQDTGDWGSATTDATGSYKLLVRPGHYTMNAYAPGHLAGVETFTIAEGENAKRADIPMPKGETKWAPCDECYERYAYDTAAATSPESATVSSTRTGAAIPQDGYAASDGSSGMEASSMPSLDKSGTRASVYEGSGGGLPPYSEAEAASTGDGQGAGEAVKTVPLPGILVVLGLLGVGALALRRR